MSPQVFSVENVLVLYEVMMQSTNGKLSAVKDVGMLESAVNSIYQTFDGKELYPSKEEKAARLAFCLINDHPFFDGNKRIGMLTMMSYLLKNGIRIEADEKELTKLGWSIADGSAKYEDILAFIKKNERFS